ncbi:MAG: hypothetical protein JSV05_09390 [Candidatus Bathyarchaeota archaeon]|nr:MAG: hypothetical protein JSV05_09390 [Candidatus Bathyarchaeota archaeon]
MKKRSFELLTVLLIGLLGLTFTSATRFTQANVGWSIETVDNTGDVGTDTSLGVG